MNTTVGIFATHKEAEKAITELRAMGVAEGDLSYVYVDLKGNMHDDVSKVSSGASSGGATGTVLGALAGLAVANGILPGIGTLFVAGPLAVALGFTGVAATTAAGAMTGLAAGALLGGLSGLGIDSRDAELYQALVQKGDVLVVARTKDMSVRDLFVRNYAGEVREYITT